MQAASSQNPTATSNENKLYFTRKYLTQLLFAGWLQNEGSPQSKGSASTAMPLPAPKPVRCGARHEDMLSQDSEAWHVAPALLHK